MIDLVITIIIMSFSIIIIIIDLVIIIIIVMVMMKIHTYSITDMEESFNQFRCRDLPKDPTRDQLVLVQY